MKEIHVIGWTDKKMCEFELAADEFDISNVLHEGSVYQVTTSQLLLSHDVSKLQSKILDNNSKMLVYGEADNAIDRGIELALSSVCNGEQFRVKIKVSGKYVIDSITSEDVEVEFIGLLNIESDGKLIHDFSNIEKLELAQKYKSLGVETLKTAPNSNAQNVSAFLLFGKAIKLLATILTTDDLNEDQHSLMSTMKMHCYNNIAQYHLRTRSHFLAIASASQTLLTDPNNIKALYRRSIAYTEIQEYEKAKSDLTLAILYDPTNKALKKQFNLVMVKVKQLDQQYANAMKKFLS